MCRNHRLQPRFERTSRASAACWRTLTRLALAPLLLACEPKLIVGQWSCAEPDGGQASVAAADPLPVPWSTGFEDGLCDYYDGAGHCYANEGAAYDLVTSPVRSGKWAASFSVVASTEMELNQTRCVREGILPSAAYYGAFFFIPSAPEEAEVWNLFHFRGSEPGRPHGLWDVSLGKDADGHYRVFVFDFLNSVARETSDVPAVPIGAWFGLEVYFERAADDTGAFRVYQDGQLALDLTDVITDDSEHGAWFVGNSVLSVTPPKYTLYVDDVSIRQAP